MKITNILINQMVEPLGFKLDNFQVTFAVEDLNISDFSKVYKKIKIFEAESNKVIYLVDYEQYENNQFNVKVNLKARTKYIVEISIKALNQEVKASSFFETGKLDEPYLGKWIASPDKTISNTLFCKKFQRKNVGIKRARLYASGLGLYEAYLNHQKIGNEYLSPGFTNYQDWIQVQTYDVTSLMQENLKFELLFSVGDGWYKGRLGFDGGKTNIFGDQQMIIAELHLDYEDGSKEVIKTDSSWRTAEGKVTKAEIYYGEDFDENKKIDSWQAAIELEKSTDQLTDRLSLPIIIHEKLPVKKIIKTPKNEAVLDFGQNHAGWPSFFNTAPKGKKVTLTMGEILQDGNFYKDNLRKARASFTYISNGEEKWIRPHFTYFGFRYVKVEGIDNVKKENFESLVLYSNLLQTGKIETNNEQVNKLFNNVLWGQKSNFFDIPTDCPQRDERLGWTGDAEIFAKTASFNMNSYEFFKKYAYDMKLAQEENNGKLPIVVPDIGLKSSGMAIWSDAATIIPWLIYKFYGNKDILKQNYFQMKSWVNWIGENTTTKDMWTGGMQLGDWLALDNGDRPNGRTDSSFLATLYYLISTQILANSAQVLEQTQDHDYYQDLTERIKSKLCNKYVTMDGKVAINTQTALALALKFNLVLGNQKKQVTNDLVELIKLDNNHLSTGFVGTPYLLSALSDNGKHEKAVDLFLNDNFPSWLYEVKMGATTMWERWNSVLPDGRMNPKGMNSLNHYSFGAVMSWMYEYVVGFRKFDPGFRNITFAPLFDYRLRSVKASLKTSYGKISVNYKLEINKAHKINLEIDIPFGMNVKMILPRNKNRLINVNGQEMKENIILKGGEYHISYIPTQSYVKGYELSTSVSMILENRGLVHQIDSIDGKILEKVKHSGNIRDMFIDKSLMDLLEYEHVSKESTEKIEKILKQETLY
ncbi:alpha-L-rhamnosidase [Lactobacillus isalae]|uniref:alpha-L-rhamnosidase n=2 Tax=Lactobacillus TaxID=1578 RepID=UPI0024A8E432|nr:alpha-L-rhamnosidase [Lactobacillus isalae]